MPDGLSTTVRSDGTVALIDLVGDIDGSADGPLIEAYEAASGPAVTRVVLNFGGVGYINSTGIAVIVQLLARARADRRDVHAFGLSDHYRQIFEITRLADFVTIRADEASAIA